jgi:hypothetical protein
MSNRRVSASEDEEVQLAEERLASNVLPSEYDELMCQRYELNNAIHWRKVAEARFKDLLQFVEEIMFEPTDFSKVLPTKNLFDRGKFIEDLVDGGRGDRAILRKHFLVLKMAKKLLGILKTRVKAELDSIQTLKPVEEEELVEIIELVRERTSQRRGDSKAIPLPPPTSKSPDKEDMGEIIVSAKVKGKKPRPDCFHTRVRTTYWKDSSGNTCTIVYCKECDAELRNERVITAKITKKKDQKSCAHTQAEWIPGQEGRVARCGEPSCRFVLKEAHTYRWREAGLEEYGDDPTKDEVLIFGERTEVEA